MLNNLNFYNNLKYVFLETLPNDITTGLMIFFRLKYLKYLLFSRHRRGYGIHSPFVFDLVSRVFRNKIDPRVVFKIENIRKKNISGSGIISVLDLGAGSARMKNSSRKVSDIVRYSAVPEKYGILLSRLACEFGKPDIIELGTSAGIGAMYLALACPGSNVFTIEGCRATAEIARENFALAGISNIELITGSFDDKLPELVIRNIKPGLAFIDGNHRKEPTVRYFNSLANISGKDSVIIIDDIHSSKEMEEAWAIIKDHEKVTMTIDIFRMGLVFFREGLNRYCYTIRY
jgi:predicted O-methyltransferase YrrM